MFDSIRIRNKTEYANNIHLAVYPFPHSSVRAMDGKGDYQERLGSLPSWQKTLADELWDNIPSLQHLFFSNGKITIQHSGAFEDNEIIDAAIQIITPYLISQLALVQRSQIGTPTTPKNELENKWKRTIRNQEELNQE